MTWDPTEDAWFSGFADGEGSFHIAREARTRRCRPAFSINLRADDGEILRILDSAFGGPGLHYHTRPRTDLPGTQPSCLWRVSSKRDLTTLVRYFDRFPLRAKKANDYAIWRQAIVIFCRFGGLDYRLPPLRERLMDGRRYNADPEDFDLEEELDHQLRFDA